MLNKFVVIDLETTGNIPKKGDKIIQFAAVVIENGNIIRQFSSLINPQKSIPAFIEELTGINDEMVKDAPLFVEIATEVAELLEEAYFVAHNVLFDLSFLQEELIQAGLEGYFGPVLDTVEMARILFPTADGYKLSDLAARENLKHDRPHQADSDALVTAELLLILLNKLSSLSNKTLGQLELLSGGLKSDLQQLLEELLLEQEKTSKGLPSFQEMAGNLVVKATPVNLSEKPEQIDYHYPDNEEDKIDLMKQGFQSFEKRDGQFVMMDLVIQAFEKKHIALIEAGTGVGKSLGYLLPAAYFSKRNGCPVVISTHTIQLQEQILKNEIPLLKKILPFPIESVLMKGRSNYISLERFEQTLREENDNYDTTLSKMQILIWLTETETGDRDELNLSSGGQLYWNKIKNDPSAIHHKKRLQTKDFYLQAQHKAREADFIITNHSLFLRDLALEKEILPEFDYCIIDEGHHFERQAVLFFGHSLDYLSTRLLLGQFGHYEQRLLFYQMEEMIATIKKENNSIVHTFEISRLFADLLYEMDELFKMMVIYAKKTVSSKKGINRVKVRFSEGDGGREKSALIHCAERFTFLIKDLLQMISERLEMIKNKRVELTIKQQNQYVELSTFVHDLKEIQHSIQDCFIRESHYVRWIEFDSRSPQNVTTFHAQPARVAGALRERLFEAKKGIAITSATLTVNQSFDYMIKEMGLESSKIVKRIIPSPFEYQSQVKLLIPEDLPEINSVSLDEYVASISEHIITIAEATKGRMLILFTAYEMLKKTYELIKESGYLDEFVMIAQGITSGSASRLTRNFKRYDKAILFGTSSFWEGIDIPGEDLSCLVIVRLPFSPPDEPITEAKCQLITHSGGNAFTEYSLPEAVLRFKQGFGRLIRTETDRGIMFVFDKRIVTTKYGKAFLQSIPAVPIKRGNIDELVEIIHGWL